MGYQPNPMARGLAHFKQTSKIKPVHAALAFINSYPEPAELHARPDFQLLWRGAARSAEKFGYRLEEFSVNEKQPLKRLERIFLTRNIRGIIIGRWRAKI